MKRAFLVVAAVGLLSVPVPAGPPAQSGEIDPDDVVLSVAVEEDGDAVWTVEYRVRLDTESRETAFEEYRDDVESDPATYRERFHNRMNATAGDGAAATGREMAIRNVTVTTDREELPQAYGVVTYRVRWTNFAATAGDRLVVGDALEGLFLDNETTLVVEAPDGYEVSSATPAPSETRTDAVVWNGPTRFTTDEPRVRLAPADDGTDAGAGPPASPVLLAVAAVALAAALGGGLVAARRNLGPFGTDDPEPSNDLLSNEEQVIRLLERNGGRMKQADVAEALGWTDAKTSQVTTGLREEGELEAFRLGRENVLELPDESDT